MALVNTTAAAAIGANDTAISVTATAGFADKQLIRVDNEWMAQVGAAAGLVVQVRRGLEGSAQIAHGILANVTTGLSGDWPSSPAGSAVSVAPTPGRISIGADTTLTTASLPTGNTTYVITKGSACVITLEAPSKAQDGLQVTFRSASAFAHTVTYAAGYLGTAGSSDIATFTASVGASMTIEANAGTWGVIALSSVAAA